MIKTVAAWLAPLLLVLFIGLFVHNCNMSKKYSHLLTDNKMIIQKYNTELKRHTPSLVESSKKLVDNKILEQEIKKIKIEKKNLEQDLIKARNSVRVVTKVITRTKIVEIKGAPSTKVILDRNKKIVEHIKELRGALGLPLAKVSFKTQSTKPWSYTIYPRRYKLDILQTINSESSLPNKIVVQARVIGKDGKEKKLNIEDVKTIISRPTKTKFGLAPFRLELHGIVGVGLSSPTASFGLAIGSHLLRLKYSKEINDDWRFLGVLIGVHNTGGISATIHPASYNLGNLIPGLSDLFISVGVGASVIVTSNPTVIPIIVFSLGSTL